MFQSTPSREGRLSPVNGPASAAVFQSTPSREGRRDAGAIGREQQVSIHALARRATATA